MRFGHLSCLLFGSFSCFLLLANPAVSMVVTVEAGIKSLIKTQVVQQQPCVAQLAQSLPNPILPEPLRPNIVNSYPQQILNIQLQDQVRIQQQLQQYQQRQQLNLQQAQKYQQYQQQQLNLQRQQQYQAEQQTREQLERLRERFVERSP
jgi:hypothetical protein